MATANGANLGGAQMTGLNGGMMPTTVVDLIRDRYIVGTDQPALAATEPPMSTHLVNLDALILREDFEASATNAPKKGRLSTELKIEDLERTYAGLLRKPDFQRETSGWSAERVAAFIKSAVDGDLVPAVIMWWSNLNGTVFVIDGAHRLSALLAWVHDDYGDGKISNEFWGHNIAPEQIKLAKATRALVNQEVGAYAQLKYHLQNPRQAPELLLLRARNMVSFKIDLQWVEGTPDTAESSFFRINGSAVAIDRTELGIIKARRKPNAIATRALMNYGVGHKYWSRFPDATQGEIESLAKEIYEALFRPILEYPARTLDIPIGGQGYSANSFKMILDVVNLVNDITPAMWQEKPESRLKGRKGAEIAAIADDDDGAATVRCLKAVKKAAALISGDYVGSLGLHPAVYFYGPTLRIQPTAFLATIQFARELRERDQFKRFTKHRRDFEEFLIAHPRYVGSLGHTYGSRTRPLEALLVMYRTLLDQLASGESDHARIEEALFEKSELRSLKTLVERPTATRRRLDSSAKSASFLQKAIQSPVRCDICGARLHLKSISHDHITRVQDGGLGTSDNATPTHPYCNTGYKESEVAAQRNKREPSAAPWV